VEDRVADDRVAEKMWMHPKRPGMLKKGTVKRAGGTRNGLLGCVTVAFNPVQLDSVQPRNTRRNVFKGKCLRRARPGAGGRRVW
jgi:hypothetical protein